MCAADLKIRFDSLKIAKKASRKKHSVASKAAKKYSQDKKESKK